MPDSWLVTGNLWGIASPGPTTLELASYCIADEGIDFDAGSLFKDTYSESPAFDGGQLAFSQSGIRHFRFPLRIASNWPGPNGLQGAEDHLRRLIRNPQGGGYIDLLPQGASYSIRFDILDGRLDWRTYSVHRQRIARRDFDLELDVQPFGYLPTTMLLASAPLASGPVFSLAWNTGSVIGDAPGDVAFRIDIGSLGSWFDASGYSEALDGLYWSMSRQPGATMLWQPSVMVPATANSYFGQGPYVLNATAQADPMAPAGVSLGLQVSPTVAGAVVNLNVPAGAPGLKPLCSATVSNTVPQRGRFRLLAWMRSHPSHGVPWQISADVKPAGFFANVFLASSNPVATLSTQVRPTYVAWPGGPNVGPNPSHWTLLDLGEHSLPQVASGASTNILGPAIQLWYGSGTSNMGIATPFIDVGGFVLLPVSGDAGILANGLGYPTVGGNFYTLPDLVVDGISRRMMVGGQFFGGDFMNNMEFDVRHRHYGDYPGLSTQSELTVVPFMTPGALSATPITWPHTYQARPHTAASLWYRPRFSFLKGL